MNRKHAKLIVMTGPESSGKTVLGKTLSDHFKVSFVEEQARLYLSGKADPYQLEDVISIGEMQSAAIEEALSRSREMVIVDTWIYVLMVWSKIRFGRIPGQFFEWKSKFTPSLYVLCKPDFPWSTDPLREHPHHREALFQLYRAMLLQDNVPLLIADGPEGNRFSLAKERVEKLFE